MKKLQENIVKFRKANNLSQETLADKIGVSRQAVSKWERGEAYPDLNNLNLLADVFNISLDELVGKAVKAQENPTQVQFQAKRKQFVNFVALLSFISYLILGYAFNGWAYWLILYLMIPLSYVGFTFFYKKN